MSRVRAHSADQLSFVFADACEPRAVCVAQVAPLHELAPPPQRRPKKARKIERPPARPISQEDRRLTVEETASLLGVSVKTLEAWRRLGKGPMFVKLGRSVRYTMRALDQFTSDRTVQNSAEGRMLDVRR